MLDNKTVYEILNETRRMLYTQRDGLYNVILTISGGALILSLNLVERVETNFHYLRILKSSWIFLTICIISNIVMRFFFSVASHENLERQHSELENLNEKDKVFYKFKPELKFERFANIFFCLFWLSFLIGLILLLIFAIVIT